MEFLASDYLLQLARLNLTGNYKTKKVVIRLYYDNPNVKPVNPGFSSDYYYEYFEDEIFTNPSEWLYVGLD